MPDKPSRDEVLKRMLRTPPDPRGVAPKELEDLADALGQNGEAEDRRDEGQKSQ